MLGIGAVLLLISSLGIIAGVALLIPKSKRHFGKRLLIISPVLLVAAVVLATVGADHDAKEAGFDGSADRNRAREAGYTEASLWHQKLAEDKAKTDAEKAAAAAQAAEEARKLAAEKEASDRAKKEQEAAAQKVKDEQCRQDLSCWAEKHFVNATFACRQAVEKLAKFDFEWTDGMIEPKFSRYRWKNTKHDIVTYIGDKIKFQNGFGAFMNHVYSCDYDTSSDLVLSVSAKPGRL